MIYDENMLTFLKLLILTRLESYYDPSPSTNQSTSLKSGLTLSSFAYVRMFIRTDTITRNNEPLFKLVLWFVLGRGSIDPLSQTIKQS